MRMIHRASHLLNRLLVRRVSPHRDLLRTHPLGHRNRPLRNRPCCHLVYHRGNLHDSLLFPLLSSQLGNQLLIHLFPRHINLVHRHRLAHLISHQLLRRVCRQDSPRGNLLAFHLGSLRDSRHGNLRDSQVPARLNNQVASLYANLLRSHLYNQWCCHPLHLPRSPR
jgi:hypothetical protein